MHLSNLDDYYQTLRQLILPLFLNGNLLITVATISFVILFAWLVSRLVLRNLKGSKLYQRLIANLIFPLLATFGLGINLIAASTLPHLNAWLICYCLVGMLIFILIRLANSIIGYTFAHKSYVNGLSKLTSFSLLLVALIAITDANDNIVNFLDNLKLNFGKTNSISVWDLLRGCTTIIVAFLFAMLANRFVERKINQLKHIDNNLQQIITRVSKILIFILVSMITLPLIGIDMTVLSVFGGAIGVGIGFGLQKISSNFLSGFIILLDRSIRVGDRLIVDNNAGNVTKITTRYVVLERADGTEVLIPNEKFVTDSIQNQSYSNTNLRVELIFSFSNNSDIYKGMELIQETMVAAPQVLPNEPSVVISKLIPGGVEVKGYFWVGTPAAINPATNYIYITLITKFKNNNILTPETTQKIEICNTDS